MFSQGDESSSESKQDKPKDDPVVDLFPDDDAEERNSEYLFLSNIPFD